MFPGSHQVAIGHISPHLQAIQQAWHHREKLWNTSTFTVRFQFGDRLRRTVVLALSQPTAGLQRFQNRYVQALIHLPGMHGALCPAHPDEGIIHPALGATHQYPQRHGEQQPEITGLFGMTGTVDQ